MRRTLCALLAAACLPAQAELKHLERIDAQLYRGRQPRPADFAELSKMGIKTILDLRGGPIHKPHERKLVQAAGMNYVSVRLSGLMPPRDAQMAKILALLEGPSHGPVFVHCRRGDDRVGMVVACYRIAHDHWTNEAALKEARHEGLNVLEVLMQRYIRHFDPSRMPHPAGAMPVP